MTKSLLLGAILDGIVAFLWSSLSWSVLPWHESEMASFQGEDASGQAVLQHITGSRLYGYPGTSSTAGMTTEQKKAAEAATFEKMKKGPIVLRLSGGTVSTLMLREFASNLEFKSWPHFF